MGPSGPAGHPGPAGVKGEPGTKGETGDILSVKVKMILFADQSDYSVWKGGFRVKRAIKETTEGVVSQDSKESRVEQVGYLPHF